MNATQEDQQANPAPMHARDVMTTNVISVSLEQSTHDIAEVLLKNRISAVPVSMPPAYPSVW